MNNICIVGRLTKDVEIEETANGIKCAKFNVAVQREYRDKNGERDTDFFSCRAWRNTAEMIAKYFFKGKAIGIIGAMHNLSQLEMAKLCKVTVQTICNIENGVQNPSKLTAQKILNVVEKSDEE